MTPSTDFMISTGDRYTRMLILSNLPYRLGLRECTFFIEAKDVEYVCTSCIDWTNPSIVSVFASTETTPFKDWNASVWQYAGSTDVRASNLKCSIGISHTTTQPSRCFGAYALARLHDSRSITVAAALT